MYRPQGRSIIISLESNTSLQRIKSFLKQDSFAFYSQKLQVSLFPFLLMHIFVTELVQLQWMDLIKIDERNERACTTPERMKLVESIKKSIHRSIQKINPAEYKNILKGQFIFIHLSYKGELINSQYTKVALFMGAIIMKKAIQKITIVITNELENKYVKKLASMGKPILSVLWLEACFQEKRKVPYDDFFFQGQIKNCQDEDEKIEQLNQSIEKMLLIHKQHIAQLREQFTKNKNLKFIRFAEKRERLDKYRNNPKLRTKIIPIQQIDLSLYQQRKSQTLSQKGVKRRKKGDNIKSLNEKQKQKKKSSLSDRASEASKPKPKFRNQSKETVQSKENFENRQESSKSLEESNLDSNSYRSRVELKKNLYEKYLKDFKSYEQECGNSSIEQIKKSKAIKLQQIHEIPIKVQEDQTPCFFNVLEQQQQNEDSCIENNVGKQNSPTVAKTPIKKNVDSLTEDIQIFQTYSIKKPKNRTIKLNIINPLISEKIEKINEKRQELRQPLFQITGNQTKNMMTVIYKESKIEAILALLSQSAMILSEKLIFFLQNSPIVEVNKSFLQKYELKCQLNEKVIKNKNIVLLDSVMGAPSLSQIIKKCNGNIVRTSQFLFKKQKIDYVVTNKKMYIRSEKEDYEVISEANLIDMLISFQK